MEKTEEQIIGIVLSDANTHNASFQIFEKFEKGISINEGMLVVVVCEYQKILARIGSIIPYNSFYKSGDLWSPVRRSNQDLPKNIATEYEVGKIDLLMRLGYNGMDIRFPPKPGDKVILIDAEKNIEEMFNTKKDEPGYIWYGSISGYNNVPLPLDIEKIPMHMAIFGTTGSGKSYDTGALIERLSDIKTGKEQNVSYPMVIIDANGDYKDYFMQFNDPSIEPLKRKIGCVGSIKRFVFSNSTELKKDGIKNLEKIAIDLDKLNPSDLANMINVFYKSGTDEGSSLALAYMDKLFTDIKNEAMENINSFFESEDKYLELLHKVDDLSSGQDDRASFHKGTGKAVKRALNKFFDLQINYKLFSEESELKSDTFIDKLVDNGSIYLIDFSADGAPGVNIETKQFVMGYLARLLFNKFTYYKTIDSTNIKYCIFLIEEAQNFCPSNSYPIGSSIAHEPLSAIATQGRKFGLSLCLVSQRPSFLDKIIVSMCNTFFIHRISPEDVNFVSSVTGGLPDSLEKRLTLLNKGEMIVTGQMITVPFPFLINIRKDKDRKVNHTAGETKVLSSLLFARNK